MINTSTSETLESPVSRDSVSENPQSFFSLEKISKSLIAAIAITVLVGGTTGYFIWKNAKLDDQIESLHQKNAEYQTQIDILKADPDVRASEIYEAQKADLPKNIEKSNAAKYIRQLDQMHKDQGIIFNGFSYVQGKITSAVTAQKWLSDDDAIRKVIRLIAGYRGNSSGSAVSSTSNAADASGSGAVIGTSAPNLFQLGPVMSVSGDSEKRNISVEFTVK